MIRRMVRISLPLACALLVMATFAQAAEDVLKLVPDSALGFVVANGPAAVDAKLQKLAQQMQLPVPSLLARLKKAIGAGEVMDEKGRLAVVVLPPEEASPLPAPVLLVPVADYGRFLAAFKPEASEGGMAKIQVAGVETWVRSIGGYAALADDPHRQVLEKTLRLSPRIPAGLAPWRGWLAENDAAVVFLPPGIKLLSAQVQAVARVFKSSAGQADVQAKQAAAVMDVYAKMFQSAEKEFAAVGVGVRLDEQGVLRVVKRARLLPGGQWARIAAQVKPVPGNLLAGLPAGPFMVAGGGAVPDAAWEALMKFSVDVMKAAPQLYGLSEERAEKISAMSVDMMRSSRGLSMVLGVGPKGSAVYSRAIVLLRVDNAQAFMAGYEKSLNEYAQLIKSAKSPILQPVGVEKVQVGGAAALQITMKAPQALDVQQGPQYARMIETMFGPEGKLVGWIVPADERTVAMGYVDKGHLERTIRAIKQGAPGLAGDADVAKTVALLPADAPWLALWSPKGTFDFVRGMIPAIVPAGEAIAMRLPEFPKTPPIGVAATVAPGEIQGHLVVPPQFFQAIGQYAAKVKGKEKPRAGRKAAASSPLEGRVVLDGKPLADGGQILLLAQGKDKPQSFPIKGGMFAGQLEPGRYRVGIRGPGVPARYHSCGTSPLTVEVREERNTFDFNLTSK